ncbi:MAG TPA: hypothetical protein PK718_03650 [Candidatus Methanofastidiosa archaeon]|nr:hypothetical protein [Candidatus Methanofastidiosa archaeon]HPR41626.1 hypothetical protein [Candidatus Methanofastidiosa archaeon]
MNNIIQSAIEHASKDYKVSILLDESDAAHFIELDVPEDVKMNLIKTGNGVYLELSGDPAAVMRAEVELYDAISNTYTHCNGQKDVALAGSI